MGFLHQILPNTHLLSYWNSYFNGIALDFARDKQCYLRKAKFLLNLHLADTKSTKYKSKLDTLAASLTGDSKGALTQGQPHVARHILLVLSSVNNRLMRIKSAN